MGDFGYLAQQIINGLQLGFVYALIALGYTMVYGIIRLINFAHGDVFMVGAFVGFYVIGGLAPMGLGPISLLLALVAAIAVCTVLAVVIERLAYRPLRSAPKIASLITAIGVSIFLQNAVLVWISSKQLPYTRADGAAFVPAKTAFTVAGVSVSTMQVFIIVTTLLLLVFLDTFVSKTRIGKAMRATSQDREAAGLMGVNINSVIALAFFIGPALGAVAGVFNGMYYGSVKFNMGFIPGIKSFTAAVIGGIGNLRGAMLGGFLLGITESLASGFISNAYRDVIAFIVLILVLIFRPGGLLGEAVAEKV